jgi:hypothetical protein
MSLQIARDLSQGAAEQQMDRGRLPRPTEGMTVPVLSLNSVGADMFAMFWRSRRECRRGTNAEISGALRGKDTNRPESVRRSIYYLAHGRGLPPASARTDVPAFLSHVMYVGTQCGFNDQ